MILGEDTVTGADDVEFTIGNVLKGLDETAEILAGVEGRDGQSKALFRLRNVGEREEEFFVSGIINDRDVLLLEEGIEPHDFPFGELTDGDDMFRGLDR